MNDIYYKIVETTYDTERNPEEVEKVIGIYRTFERATADAKAYLEKNKPEGYRVITEDDYYGRFCYVFEKINQDNPKVFQQYMLKVGEERFDD